MRGFPKSESEEAKRPLHSQNHDGLHDCHMHDQTHSVRRSCSVSRIGHRRTTTWHCLFAVALVGITTEAFVLAPLSTFVGRQDPLAPGLCSRSASVKSLPARVSRVDELTTYHTHDGRVLALRKKCEDEFTSFYTDDGRVIPVSMLSCPAKAPAALPRLADLSPAEMDALLAAFGSSSDAVPARDAGTLPMRLRGGATRIPHHLDSSDSMVTLVQQRQYPPKLTAADGERALRIALLSWESLHTVAVGGVAQHVTELAAGLERRGHEVHVFSRAGGGQIPYEIIDGVHVHRVETEPDQDFVTECSKMCSAFCWALSETERFQGGPFDICQGHDWLAAKAVVQCHQMGRHTVAAMHSTEFGRCGNVNYGGQSERIRLIEEEVVAAADRVLCVSGLLCGELRAQFQVSDEKLRVVHTGIQVHPYDGEVDVGAVKARLGIGTMDPLVLFAGRLAVQKAPDLLVEAVPHVLAQRADTRFAFVGDGHLRADLERRVEALGVGHAVRFLGGLGGRYLVELFKSADCVCVPSRSEPFGMVVLEAWASGVPVVATAEGGLREFVNHGRDGFQVEPHPASISWGILEVFSDFGKAREMGRRGRRKAEVHFNWDRIAEQTERVYREICPEEEALAYNSLRALERSIGHSSFA